MLQAKYRENYVVCIPDQGQPYLLSLRNKFGQRVHKMQPSKSSSGYLQYLLRWNGKSVLCRLHIIVAEVMFGPRFPGDEVNHIDGNKLNNRPDNLEYVSHKENMVHSKREGLSGTTAYKPEVNRDERSVKNNHPKEWIMDWEGIDYFLQKSLDN